MTLYNYAHFCVVAFENKITKNNIVKLEILLS